MKKGGGGVPGGLPRAAAIFLRGLGGDAGVDARCVYDWDKMTFVITGCGNILFIFIFIIFFKKKKSRK